MQRGFKSYAEQIAGEVRAEMGISPDGRLCAFALAEHLGVPTIPFSTLLADSQLSGNQREALHREVHGLCVPIADGRRGIIYNDSNPPTRRQSDVAHEAAHVLLQHSISDAFARQGPRTIEQEAEAVFLGGALLIPLPAAMSILRRGLTTADAAEAFGVSENMVTYRCNVSGARVIFARGRQTPRARH
jgi:Zn-dependent peptidase ImmA (M78 family)